MMKKILAFTRYRDLWRRVQYALKHCDNFTKTFDLADHNRPDEEELFGGLGRVLHMARVDLPVAVERYKKAEDMPLANVYWWLHKGLYWISFERKAVPGDVEAGEIYTCRMPRDFVESLKEWMGGDRISVSVAKAEEGPPLSRT